MGNSLPNLPNNQTESQLASVLEFYEKTESLQFGQFKIYKMKQKPFEAIMQKTFISASEDLSLVEKQKWYQGFKPDKNVIKLDEIKLEQRQQNCGKYRMLTLFCRYYFFTIRDTIKKKLQRKGRFIEHQIFYVAKTLISLWQYIHPTSSTTSEYWGFFKSKYIFLTPQGFLKIYPWINDWSRQKEGELLQNEISQSYNKNEKIMHLSLEKKQSFQNKKTSTDDLIDIGIVLMEMINLSKEEDYRKDDSLKLQIINFILNSYSDGQKTPLQIFKPLLRGLIPAQKENFWSIAKIKEELQKISFQHDLKNVFCVKVSESETDSCGATVYSDNWEEEKQKSMLKLAKSNKLIANKINSIRGEGNK